MRNRIIRVRVTEAEASEVKELAKSRALSISEMVRRAALSVRMPTRAFDATHAALIARTLGELGRIGSNLNQLTRQANRGHLNGHDAELSETLCGVDALRERLREVIR